MALRYGETNERRTFEKVDHTNYKVSCTGLSMCRLSIVWLLKRSLSEPQHIKQQLQITFSNNLTPCRCENIDLTTNTTTSYPFAGQNNEPVVSWIYPDAWPGKEFVLRTSHVQTRPRAQFCAGSIVFMYKYLQESLRCFVHQRGKMLFCS